MPTSVVCVAGLSELRKAIDVAAAAGLDAHTPSEMANAREVLSQFQKMRRSHVTLEVPIQMHDPMQCHIPSYRILSHPTPSS